MDPLEEIVAHAIVKSITKQPELFNVYLPKSPYAHVWRNGPRNNGAPITQSGIASSAQSSTPQAIPNDADLAANSLDNVLAGLGNSLSAGLSDSQVGSYAQESSGALGPATVLLMMSDFPAHTADPSISTASS